MKFNSPVEELVSTGYLHFVIIKQGPYVVDTDASNLAIGAVLSQVQDSEEKVIMYGSKAFSGSQ